MQASQARLASGPFARSAKQGHPPCDPSTEADVIKEKELLQPLRRRGKLTAVGAALETSLSVVEADRMLSELAVRGHLEIAVEHGRLHYALWEPDALP